MKNKVLTNYKRWKRAMSISLKTLTINDSLANKRFLTFEKNVSKNTIFFWKAEIKKNLKSQFCFRTHVIRLRFRWWPPFGWEWRTNNSYQMSARKSVKAVAGLRRGRPHIQTSEHRLFNKMVLWWWQRNFFSLVFCVPRRRSYNMTKMSQTGERAQMGLCNLLPTFRPLLCKPNNFKS